MHMRHAPATCPRVSKKILRVRVLRVRVHICYVYIYAGFSEARGAEISAFAPSAPHRMLLCQRLPEFNSCRNPTKKKRRVWEVLLLLLLLLLLYCYYNYNYNYYYYYYY